MALNEKTSEPVASIAGRILEMKNPRLVTDELWEQIQSVAASALSQAADKQRRPLVEDYNRFKLSKKYPNLKMKTFSDYLKESK